MIRLNGIDSEVFLYTFYIDISVKYYFITASLNVSDSVGSNTISNWYTLYIIHIAVISTLTVYINLHVANYKLVAL